MKSNNDGCGGWFWLVWGMGGGVVQVMSSMVCFSLQMEQKWNKSLEFDRWDKMQKPANRDS